MSKISFESEHRAFVFIFAGLVSLATLPVIGWHFVQTLTGLALVAIAGLAICDIVLWFASHWSVRVRSGSLRTVALVVKFGLAAVMLINAGIVIVVMRSDQQTTSLIHQQTEARRAEIEARAAAAAQLAKVQGGRAAAREAMRISDTQSVESIATSQRSQVESLIPRWYLDVGIYVTPPICALIGFMALTVCAAIVRRREAEAELQPETAPAVFPARSDRKSDQPKPVQTWRGGVVVNPREDARPN